MSERFLALAALVALVVLVIGALLTGGNLGMADSGPVRVSFQIATGSTRAFISGRPDHGGPDRSSPGRGPLRYRHGLWSRV
jgi:hypothetical protein